MNTRQHHFQKCVPRGSNERRSSHEGACELRTNALDPTSTSQTPRRVLIVDDEANARTTLAELLREQGYLVETAADGFKALPKIEAFAPDLLLTDLEMPGMDGTALMRKAQQFDPTLPVIIATASARIDTAVSAMRQGATDYLSKPLDLDNLTQCIALALEQRQPQRER